MSENNNSVLVIGDLHLYDREMSSTKGYVNSNMVMLDNLYSYIESNEHIKVVIFEGDIQHKTPVKIKESYKWRKWFRKLGQLMYERLDESGLTLEIHERDDIESLGLDFRYPVFSVKGNHDMEATNRSTRDFTFFDELLHEGYIQNPKGLTLNNDLYIDCRNYGEAARELDTTLTEGKRVIGLFHDTLYHNTSPDYLRLIRDVNPDNAYDAHTVLKGLDLALAGHIHDPETLEHVLADGTEVPYLQTGSMGRTSFGGGHLRDVGYVVEVDINTVEPLRVEVPILPVDEFFNLQRLASRNRDVVDYQTFNLDMDTVEDVAYSVEEAILSMGHVPSEVKDMAITLLRDEQ